MKKIILGLIIIIGISVFYIYKKNNTKTDKQFKPAIVEYENINEYVDTTGQVEPLNRVEILPPSGGRIEKIFIEEGNNVNSGDILALMSSQDRVAILDAARAIGEKEYNYWQDSYKPIKILAPISGRIILRNIVEGQTVSASTVLFAMSDRLIVTASVDESDIGKIKINQKAIITLDAYPDTKITGKVFQILDEGRNSNNVIIYKVKINPYTIPYFFKSQMTANIKIIIKENKKTLLVESSAINYSKDGKTYVITGFDSKNKPIEKYVDIGNEYNGKIEIKNGLSEGDQIYIEIKNYKVQTKDTNTSPFMPKRPQGQQREVMRKIR